MGIFKAASGAFGGVLADQWLEMYICESMPADVLAQRGGKKVSERSSNTKGEENVITDGSLIIVNEGQCAVVIEQGETIGVYETPGENVFHSGKTGSIFTGGGLKSVGRQAIGRIGFGGEAAVHQFVMYIDTKEKHGNPFCVSVPLNVVNNPTGLEYFGTVNLSGVFSFRISDPVVFYKRICGNRIGTVKTNEILPQLQAEMRSAAVSAVGKICGGGIEPHRLPGLADEICAALKSSMDEKWESLRGFSVVSIAVDSIALAEDDKRVIQQAERAKMLTQPDMAAATLVAAQADAMTAAANNTRGAAGAFMAVNAANMFSNPPAQSGQASNSSGIFSQSGKPSLWRCACGSMNTGNFCENCGGKRP